MVSTSDRSPKMLAELVERTLAMARAVPEDPFFGLADPDDIAHDWPALDMLDPEEPEAETLIERARAAEEAALAVKGVTNSEGAEAGWGRSRIALAASNGFAGGYAGRPRGQRLGDRRLGPDGARLRFCRARSMPTDLRDPAEIGRNAGERTVSGSARARCRPARVPVVFDPRVARGLISHLLGAISGPSIARGTSFLKDSWASGSSPRRSRSPRTRTAARPRSKPFDAEGLPNQRRALIDEGVLTTWLLDLRSARQLGLNRPGMRRAAPRRRPRRPPRTSGSSPARRARRS